MKTKHILILILTGLMISVLGAFFIMLHWPFANILLIIATIMQIMGGVFLVVKLIIHPRI